MGYAYYIVNRNGEKIAAGYAVPATCEEPDCPVKIDRGLDHLCGAIPGGDEWGCGGYFCHEHLFITPGDGRDAPQMCTRCLEQARRQFAEIVKQLTQGAA